MGYHGCDQCSSYSGKLLRCELVTEREPFGWCSADPPRLDVRLLIGNLQSIPSLDGFYSHRRECTESSVREESAKTAHAICRKMLPVSQSQFPRGANLSPP